MEQEKRCALPVVLEQRYLWTMCNCEHVSGLCVRYYGPLLMITENFCDCVLEGKSSACSLSSADTQSGVQRMSFRSLFDVTAAAAVHLTDPTLRCMLTLHSPYPGL